MYDPGLRTRQIEHQNKHKKIKQALFILFLLLAPGGIFLLLLLSLKTIWRR
jgi:hypothetical protein